MHKSFNDMKKYLDYLINDSKISDSEIALLKDLFVVIEGLSKIDDTRNKVYHHNRVIEVQDRLKLMITQYEKDKDELKKKLSLSVMDYGSERLTYLEKAINELNNILSNTDKLLNECIEKYLNYIFKKENGLLDRCYQCLGTNNLLFFGEQLITNDNNGFSINEELIEQVYTIFTNKEQVSILEQVTRLTEKINYHKQQLMVVELLIKNYGLVCKRASAIRNIDSLDKQISDLSNECDIDIEELEGQLKFYTNIPFGEYLFNKKINEVKGKINNYYKSRKISDKLFDCRTNFFLAKEQMNVNLLNNGFSISLLDKIATRSLMSKEQLKRKYQKINDEIVELEKQLTEVSDLLNDDNRQLYNTDFLTCYNLIFNLKDNQENFISLYILVMLICIHRIIDKNPCFASASTDLINKIVTEYEDLQNNRINNIIKEKNKVFSLKR